MAFCSGLFGILVFWLKFRVFRVKLMVMLGEVGGEEEYKVVKLLKEKRITKPLVAWCIGTCADYITSEVFVRHFGRSLSFSLLLFFGE